MTSKECYVYITLSNQYEQVTAGKFVLETDTAKKAREKLEKKHSELMIKNT